MEVSLDLHVRVRVLASLDLEVQIIHHVAQHVALVQQHRYVVQNQAEAPSQAEVLLTHHHVALQAVACLAVAVCQEAQAWVALVAAVAQDPAAAVELDNISSY